MKKFLVLIFVFIFSGCILKQEYNSVHLDENINEMMAQLPKNFVNLDLVAGDKVLVTDFVDLESFSNDRTQLGFILANRLKDAIIKKYGFRVKYVELSRAFRINNKGFKLSSRELKDLKIFNDFSNYVFIGSYTVTSTKLILFLQLVDINTGDILYSATSDLLLRDEIIKMHNKKKEKIFIYQPMSI